MGHWEHRWDNDKDWITSDGALKTCKSLKDVQGLFHNTISVVGIQEYKIDETDLKLRYIGGTLDEFTSVPMESPSFSLEEIKLAQKMIGQK